MTSQQAGEAGAISLNAFWFGLALGSAVFILSVLVRESSRRHAVHRAHVSRVLEKLPQSSKEEVEEALPNKLRDQMERNYQEHESRKRDQMDPQDVQQQQSQQEEEQEMKDSEDTLASANHQNSDHKGSDRHKHKLQQKASQLEKDHRQALEHETLDDLPAQPEDGLEADTGPRNYETAVARSFFPFLAALIEKVGNDLMPDLLEESKPLWMGAIKLQKLSLGTIAPELHRVCVQPPSHGRISLEADFVWKGNQELQFMMKPLPRKMGIATLFLHLLSGVVRLTMGVNDIEVRGRARANILLDLKGKPQIGGLQLAFVEQPQFSFDVALYGGDMNMMPGLEEWLTTFVRQIILKPFVLPEVLTLPVMDGRNPRISPEAPLMQPQGILIVRLLSAHDLPKTDWVTDTDAYVRFKVREGAELQSKAITNTREPNWGGEEFAFLVHEPTHQSLHLNMWDKDVVGKDEEVGWANVPIHKLGCGQTRHLEILLNSPTKDESGARQSVHLETTLLRMRALKARVKDAVRRAPPMCVFEATYLELNSEAVQIAHSNHDLTCGVSPCHGSDDDDEADTDKARDEPAGETCYDLPSHTGPLDASDGGSKNAEQDRIRDRELSQSGQARGQLKSLLDRNKSNPREHAREIRKAARKKGGVKAIFGAIKDFGGIVYVQVVRAKGLKPRSFNVFGLSILIGVDDVKGELSVNLQEIRENKRLKQSFPLHRAKKHHASRKKTAFPGHLELEIKWMDFLEGG
ncbi:hypothetical protein WJX73_001056 [Symbiochloris irregularis]|uniref:Uncharacterized protein n=1 Tax=Symbiochloris irregularis TaxID=706552 RepID=A0AAW1NSI0_9CHLO